MSGDLLPCPFCGTTCHNVAFPREFRTRMVAVIECFTDNCYAMVTADTPAQAITAWNTRTLSHPPAGEVVWRSKDTLPHPKYAGAFFAAIRTHGINSPLKWEVHLIALDDETHDVHPSYDHGWRWEDYELWTPCPWPEPPLLAAIPSGKGGGS